MFPAEEKRIQTVNEYRVEFERERENVSNRYHINLSSTAIVYVQYLAWVLSLEEEKKL